MARASAIALALLLLASTASAQIPRRAFGDMLKVATSTTAFTPLSIPGCILWLDGQDAATITMSASNTVSVWADKSGAGNHATNGMATAQPVWTNSGINGYAAINFTSDLLFLGGGVQTTNSTFVMVFRRASKNIISLPVGGSSVGKGPYPIYWATDNIPYTWMADRYRNPSANTNSGNYIVVSYVPGSTDTATVVRINRVVQSLSAGSLAVLTPRAYQIGGRATDYHAGMIGEVIAYANGSLTGAQITNLENYVNTKWSLGL